MPSSGNENHSIPLSDAAHLTKNFRNAHPGAVIAQRFGKTAIMNILQQEHCVGIRIYYAQTDEGAPQLVITGVDSDCNDLFEGLLAEYGHPCPTDCSANNPLNS